MRIICIVSVMTNEQMNPYEPCRDDGLCGACADAPRCTACGEYLPEHEDDCDREFVAAEREVGDDMTEAERVRGVLLVGLERARTTEGLTLQVRVSPEALSLFAPLASCPECRRPLPVPFNDDYRHWAGCSIAEREVA